jgi:oxepin-CoA hydrolase/3-oxo-5,6-dehydrosuberyl-CoA semialdehyde dehydrogenase
MLHVHSFAAGQWVAPGSSARSIENALTGAVMGEAGNDALDIQAMLEYGRTIGSPALRAMTFHDRAKMLKALALHLREHRQTLYDLSFNTGGTQSDHLIDVDGGIGTMLVFASKGRRDLPDAHVYLDGPPEQLGRTGAFMGRHICTPLQGVAVHINAPYWRECPRSSSQPPRPAM